MSRAETDPPRAADVSMRGVLATWFVGLMCIGTALALAWRGWFALTVVVAAGGYLLGVRSGVAAMRAATVRAVNGECGCVG